MNFMQKLLLIYPESGLIDAIGCASFSYSSAGKIPHCLPSRTDKGMRGYILPYMKTCAPRASIQPVTTQSHFPEWLV